jgi:DNA-binding transcriptional MerR regulator
MKNQGLTVKEVAAKTGLSVHTLRYYEQIGIIHPVERAGNQHRIYSPKDLEWIAFLVRLRSTGMPVKEMALYAQMVREGDATITARRELMEKHRETIRSQIQELETHLQLIEKKVEYYRRKEANVAGPAEQDVSEPISQEKLNAEFSIL